MLGLALLFIGIFALGTSGHKISFRLYIVKDDEKKNDHDDETQPAARIISPRSAIRINGKRAEKRQEDDNDKNSFHREIRVKMN